MPIRTTPNAIFKKLGKLAPDIEVSVDWTEDSGFVWDGEGPDPREEGYVVYDVEVSARATVDGDERTTREFLGGVYDLPGAEDPDIHGYLPQMLHQVLNDLLESDVHPGPREWSPRPITPIFQQAMAGREYLREVMQVRHEANLRRLKRRKA